MDPKGILYVPPTFLEKTMPILRFKPGAVEEEKESAAERLGESGVWVIQVDPEMKCDMRIVLR
jgi:hypothetical protein